MSKKALIDPRIQPGGIVSRKGAGIILPDREDLMRIGMKFGFNFGLFYLFRKVRKWLQLK